MTSDKLSKKSQITPWIFFSVAVLVPFIAWASMFSWHLSRVSLLGVFPLLGLWAWSIMWTHYAYGTTRILEPSFQKNIAYSKVTGILVLLLILLHPGLLAWNQWQILSVLPPASLYGYVASSMKVFIYMGSLALLIFLSYEVFERMKDRVWVSRNWALISFSQMLAMVLIFIHALQLGVTFNNSWFEFYWVILGALLIPCFGIIGREDIRSSKR